MKIAYKQYRIEPADHAVGRYDLVEEIEKQKLGEGTKDNPTGEKYIFEEQISYGVTLERAIQSIITMETERNFKDKNATLKEFLEEYVKQKDELKRSIEQVLTIKIK